MYPKKVTSVPEDYEATSQQKRIKALVKGEKKWQLIQGTELRGYRAKSTKLFTKSLHLPHRLAEPPAVKEDEVVKQFHMIRKGVSFRL